MTYERDTGDDSLKKKDIAEGTIRLEQELFKIKDTLRRLQDAEKEIFLSKEPISSDSIKQAIGGKIHGEVHGEAEFGRVRINEPRGIKQFEKQLEILGKETERLKGLKVGKSRRKEFDLSKKKERIRKELGEIIEHKEIKVNVVDLEEIEQLENQLKKLRGSLRSAKSIRVSDSPRKEIDLSREKEKIEEELENKIKFKEIEVEELWYLKKLESRLKKLKEDLKEI